MRAETPSECTLSVSIVLYRPDEALLQRTLESLAQALEYAGLSGTRLFLIDNSEPGAGESSPIPPPVTGRRTGLMEIIAMRGHGNVGYGRGHNLALPGAGSRFHLVLNPDVELATDALANALRFFEREASCVLLSPLARWPDGEIQQLCKRFPSLDVLLARAFAPAWLRRRLQPKLDRYEMRDVPLDTLLWDPPLVSGCFMLFRTRVLRQLGGFDPAYFLYFEDFDLSVRAARLGRIARVPEVRIVHHGGRAATKGLRHIALFVRAGWRFFGTHRHRGA